ncbi:MAG: hypothetical protein DWQ20_01135 [Actinobacteria bacterium]|nr:MAG: hypothetical protein DWQ20_01135 [Actinomycetota bacterium]
MLGWLLAGLLLLSFWPVSGIAGAAPDTLYLRADGYPTASMSMSSLPGGALGNYDPSRNDDPGLTIQAGGSGPGETNPNLYQEWEFDAAGSTFSVNNLTIWVAAEGFEKAGVSVTAHLLRCSSTCALLNSSQKSVANAFKWKKMTFSLQTPTITYESDESLVVKIVVDGDSEANALLAYGIQTYDSGLGVTGFTPPPPSTTTSTSTTTTTTSPGPPNPPPTSPPPTGPPTTRPERPTTTTTAPQTPTTTTQATTTTSQADDDQAVVGGGADTGEGPPTSASGSPFPGPAPEFDPPPEDVLAGFQQQSALSPQEGLMVAFATTAEAVDLYWQIALALGILMATLASAGFRDDGFDKKARASERLRRFSADWFD